MELKYSACQEFFFSFCTKFKKKVFRILSSLTVQIGQCSGSFKGDSLISSNSSVLGKNSAFLAGSRWLGQHTERLFHRLESVFGSQMNSQEAKQESA